MKEKKGRRRAAAAAAATATTIEDLADDLKVAILRRLPRSSILQFLEVSKRWRSLIRDGPLSLANTINVAADYSDKRLRCMCLEKGMQQILETSELEVSIDSSPNYKRSYDNWIISSCNGLLFSYFSSHDGCHECYISNPWTKESVRLPKPAMTSHKSTLCGLAFDNDNNNNNNNVASYKIVMAHRIDPYTMEGRYNYSYKFEIYSSVKKRWQLLDGITQPHPCQYGPWGHLDLGQKGVYCNRVLYWYCSRVNHALMFNLDAETSGYMELPSADERARDIVGGRSLTVCDGLLHYIRTVSRYNYHRLHVWMMSMVTGGWSMLYNVDLVGVLQRNLDFFPLCRCGYSLELIPIDMSCQGDNKVLLAEYSGEIHLYYRIISYDLRRDVLEVVLLKNFKDLKFCRYTPTNKSIIDRIITKESQHECKTKRSKQSKQPSKNRKLFGRLRSAS